MSLDETTGRFLNNISKKVEMKSITEAKESVREEDAPVTMKNIEAMLRKIVKEELATKYVLTEGTGTAIKLMVGSNLFEGAIKQVVKK